ncbi:MAG: lipopolysaccharide transport periplasmic protein LptA [Candidatus Nitrospinota bacterium M3_3B_026]
MIRPLAAAAAMAALLLATPPIFAQESLVEAESAEDKEEPLEVVSDRMVSDNKANKISFYGSVVAVKGALKVESDEMYVWTDEKQEQVREIEAIGSVKITREGKVATGDKANYLRGRKKITLLGAPATLDDGKNTATGRKVIYYLDSEDMEIFSGGETRSTLILYPKEEEKEQGQNGEKGKDEKTGDKEEKTGDAGAAPAAAP